MISSKAMKSMALVIVSMASTYIVAGEPTAANLYGKGVHAYFAGDYDSAIAWLTESIQKNEGDPRAYYFRGLAKASRDGVEAGLADFATGAELEVDPVDEKYYNVNGALQRVQGRLRVALEQQRSAVKKAAAEKKKRQERVKYEQLKRREEVVLYKPGQPSMPADQPAKERDLELPEVELGIDPFATDAAFSGGDVVKSAEPDLTEETEDTVAGPAAGESEKPSETVAGKSDTSESPFGDTTPAAKPGDEEEKPDESDPFDGENPFGDTAAKTPSANPLFDDSVRPELPMSMDVGGNIMNVLEKTLSGKSSDRDPFSDEESAAAPKSKTAAESKAPTEGKVPAEKKTPAEEEAEPEKKPKLDDNPFD